MYPMRASPSIRECELYTLTEAVDTLWDSVGPMNFYAHTKTNLDRTVAPEEEWEPLYSGDCGTLRGEYCKKCATLGPNHGHLRFSGE